jgi:hypothetical protein
MDDRLVIGVASSALFDLTESQAVFDEYGESAYRTYQETHLNDPLAPGVAFQFVIPADPGSLLAAATNVGLSPDDIADRQRIIAGYEEAVGVPLFRTTN